jgi:hypothetical protein
MANKRNTNYDVNFLVRHTEAQWGFARGEPFNFINGFPHSHPDFDRKLSPYFGDHLILGDSQIVRAGRNLGAEHKKDSNGNNVLGLCQSGNTARRMRGTLERLLFSSNIGQRHPQFRFEFTNVIIALGTNDISNGLSAEEIVSDLKSLEDLLKNEFGTRSIVYIVPPPCPFWYCISYYQQVWRKVKSFMVDSVKKESIPGFNHLTWSVDTFNPFLALTRNSRGSKKLRQIKQGVAVHVPVRSTAYNPHYQRDIARLARQQDPGRGRNRMPAHRFFEQSYSIFRNGQKVEKIDKVHLTVRGQLRLLRNLCLVFLGLDNRIGWTPGQRVHARERIASWGSDVLDENLPDTDDESKQTGLNYRNFDRIRGELQAVIHEEHHLSPAALPHYVPPPTWGFEGQCQRYW